jgi:hypothetical protein
MRTSGPGQSAKLLLDVVEILRLEKVDYAVIGAMAASVHGIVRASLNADAVLSLALEQLRELEKQFKTARFNTQLRSGGLDDPIAGLLKVSDAFENRVDLLVGLRGLETAAFARALDIPFLGASLRVIGREDFIAMKLFAGGPLDIDDARRAISATDSLDTALLHRLANQFGADTALALRKVLNLP